MADDYPDDTTTTGVLPIDGTVNGVIETVGDADWFQLEIATGRGYLFSPMMADGKVPALTVWNARTGMVAYTTVPGGLYSHSLDNPFVPIERGDYYLEIGGALAGSYTVGMREAPDDAGNDWESVRTLTATAPVAARFDYAFDSDRFRIAVVAGTTYTVTVSADSGGLGSASFLRLMSSTAWYGEELLVEGGATTSYTFTAKGSGDKFVVAQMASQYPPAAGGLAYHMSLTAVDTRGPQLFSARGSVDGGLRLFFDEDVRLGAGAIDLVDASGNIVEHWSMREGQVHVEGGTLTTGPGHAHALMPGYYEVRFGSDSVIDASGNLAAPYIGVEVQGTSGGGLALSGSATPGTTGAFLAGGGSAADAVVYAGLQEDYTISRDGDGFRISARWGGPADTLFRIDQVLFTQSGNVVALSLDGHLGQAYRLYTAAFDRAPDPGGLGFWLQMADKGVSLNAMARGFIDSAEFADLYGAAPDDSAFVSALYHNILHREGETDGIAFWMGTLASGIDRAEVLAAFSESWENIEQVAQLVGSGVVYTPYG